MKPNKKSNPKIIKNSEIKGIDFFNPLKDFENEIWKEISFTDKRYEISNYGRLKSYTYNKTTGIILRNKRKEGYLATDMQIDGVRKSIFIHKLVADYFVHKEDESKAVVIHIDNNKENNQYTNLKWVDFKEKFAHSEKFNKNLKKKFRNNQTSNAKLTATYVEWIREMLKKDIPQKTIASMFKVSEMQITRIKRNENWVIKKDKDDQKEQSVFTD